MKKIVLTTLAAMLVMVLPTRAQSPVYLGGDISVLPQYEKYNVSYKDQQGKKINDVMKYMKSEAVGWNALRVRLFVNPEGLNGKGEQDPQVCQDLDYVISLGKRIKEEGFAFMLDFHYSDTWADPSYQWIPKAWLSLTDDELTQKVYDYTKDCLEKLVAADATPDFIQTGNEISYGMLWGAQGTTGKRCYPWNDNNWNRFLGFLKQASKACREVCPNAQIIIHTERTGKPDDTVKIYDRIVKASLDFDIIGLSYYPFWHNGLSTLATTLNKLNTNFPAKKVQIVETAYYFQYQPSDVTYNFSSKWPVSKDGQAAYAKDLVEELRKHDNVNGLYWWFPEENGNGPSNAILAGWVNRGLWNPTTHYALPALYVLKDFLGDDTGIESAKIDTQKNGRWYNMQGICLQDKPNRSGIYVYVPANGKPRTVKLTEP